MQTNVLEYLESAAARFPDKTAIVDETGKTSFSELLKSSKAIASRICAATDSANKPVAVLCGRNRASIASFLGVLYSGNFYAPIDAATPVERLEKMLGRLEPAASVIAAPVSEEIRVCGRLGGVIGYDEAVSCEIDENALAARRRRMIDADPAYTIFTSGSTGVPKGAVICHRGIIDLAEWLAETFDFSENDIVGNQTPFYFDASVKDIYMCLKNGATMHILPKKLFSFPAALIGYMNENRINTILWATSCVRLIANSGILPEMKPMYLKKVFFAGEDMSAKHINIWRRHIPNAQYINLYGPTEITVDAAYHILCRDYQDGESIPIGIPCRNKEILLMTEDGRLAAHGETGEICVRGSGVSFGYYNDTEKTAAAFVQNPLNKSYNEILYKTGDLARYNGYGELVFVSRSDAQVKHMGNRIELGEIETAVNALPEIEACACLYDTEKEAIVLVYQGAKADKPSILRGLEEKLPKYMFPGVFVKLDKLPENANGKIDRRRLAEEHLGDKPAKIQSMKELNALLMPYMLKKHITNDYTLPRGYASLIESGRLLHLRRANAVILLANMDNYYRMYYHLTSLEAQCSVKADKTLTMEVAYRNGEEPPELKTDFWERSGFVPAVRRVRMAALREEFLPDTDVKMEGTACFAAPSDIRAIEEILQDGFDKHTGFLPTRSELEQGISANEVLIFKNTENAVKGVLRFSKNASISTLGHIAVAVDARGSGISKALLTKWRDIADCGKYLLWVREDNAAARSLYEKSGFIYDGWEAVTLIKQPQRSRNAL